MTPFGPGPGGGGPSPFSRQGFAERTNNMTATNFWAAKKMGFMPGHSSNILTRLQQSGCCPGARASGVGTAKTVTCANGSSYQLDNWQGGIRATRVQG